MIIDEVIAVLTFLIKNEPAIAQYVGELISLFNPSDPTDNEMQAKRIAEYIRVAVSAWQGCWNLDYGQGEEGNVRARDAWVTKSVRDYAIAYKNEQLTAEQLATIVRTARGLSQLGIGAPPPFQLVRRGS